MVLMVAIIGFVCTPQGVFCLLGVPDDVGELQVPLYCMNEVIWYESFECRQNNLIHSLVSKCTSKCESSYANLHQSTCVVARPLLKVPTMREMT